MKFVSRLILLFLTVFSLPAHAENTIVIGGEPSAPYYFEQDGKIVGSDAEIVKFILNKLGVDYTLEVMSGARLETSLANGSVDIAVSVEDIYALRTIADYLNSPTRIAEYVLITNYATKEAYNATSLEYVKSNNLQVGIVSNDPYNQQFWDLYPWKNKDSTGFNDELDVAIHIESNLLKLDRNRINVFPSDRLSAQYQINSLGLNNVTNYDFIIFFKPLFNSFSRQSTFSNGSFSNIDALRVEFEETLIALQELPEYFRLNNIDINSAYAQKNLRGVEFVDEPKTGETINIGFLAALTGPDAGWGKPGLTGNQLFIDRVNSKGGLLVNGVRYPLKMHIFDDEADGAKALAGAKQLVERHNVKFISAIGGAGADATHPYLTNKKVIYASLIATDIHPDRPYLLAGGDVTPRIDMLRPWYHKNKNPDLSRWAVVSQGDPIGRACQAWEVGSAIAEGWDVVYDEHFPIDGTDFASLVKNILKTNPDVVSLNLTWPDYVTEILDELHNQGYKGEISGNYMDVDTNLSRVPVEFHENAVDSFPLFNDPYWGTPSVQHTFFENWMSQYGPGAPKDLNRNINGIDWDHVIMLEVWAYGAQLAGSFDPDEIITALRNEPLFPTILGSAKMSGDAMWGIKNMVSPPIPINETINGVKRIQTIKLFDEWFASNRERIIPVVKSKGFYWGKEPVVKSKVFYQGKE